MLIKIDTFYSKSLSLCVFALFKSFGVKFVMQIFRIVICLDIHNYINLSVASGLFLFCLTPLRACFGYQGCVLEFDFIIYGDCGWNS